MFHQIGNNSAGECRPQLKILVQPKQFYRFRYMTEMYNKDRQMKFHGILKGSGGAFPTVKLINFGEECVEVYIRVSLFTADDFKPHMHQIAYKGEGSSEWEVKSEIHIQMRNFEAIIKNLIIIRKPEAEWIKEEVERLVKWYKETYKTEPMEDLRKQFGSQAKKNWSGLSLNSNRVRLGFHAYNNCEFLGEPTYSEPISNSIDPTVGELKIFRMSACTGRKGEEVMFLVSKMTSSKVEVRFFDENIPIWERYAQKIYDHHQVALVVTVPEYIVDMQTELKVQLERTAEDKSKTVSEALPFTYMPLFLVGKRRNTTPFCSADQKVLRTIGESHSESSLHVQREENKMEYQMDQAQSLPNMMSDTQQGTYSFPDDTSSGESNSNYAGYSYNQEIVSNTVENYSASGIMDGVHHCELQSLIEELEKLPDKDIPWVSDLANKTQNRGKGKLYVETDGIDKKPSGSQSKAHNKDQNRREASTQQPIILFSEALFDGKVEELKIILTCLNKKEQEILVNETYAHEQTPLIIATKKNNTKCVQLLCSAGANVNFQDEEGNTAFHIAAKESHVKCLEVLLEDKSRDIDKKNAKGETALHLAVLRQSVESVQILLKAGASVNERNGTAGSTPLHLAVQLGCTEVVQILLKEENLNVNVTDYADMSAADLVKADQEDIIDLFEEDIIVDVDIEEETDQ